MNFIISTFLIIIFISISAVNSFHCIISRIAACNQPQSTSPTFFQLYTSKHHARYGQFLDSMKQKKEAKLSTYDSLIDEDTLKKYQRDAVNGQDMKKSREKDLKIAQKMIPMIDYSVALKTRKWSQDRIEQVIECLNRSYGMKERSELNDDERVGVIDWFEFDKVAEEIIDSYVDNEVVRRKVKSWIVFHREKKEILFDNDSWIWKPRRPYLQKKRKINKNKKSHIKTINEPNDTSDAFVKEIEFDNDIFIDEEEDLNMLAC